MKQAVLYLSVLLLIAACSYNAYEFEQDDDVTISSESKYVYIEPVIDSKSTGIVFYPGGLVEPDAYISTLQPLAVKGYPVIILKSTADLAIFNINRASNVIDDFPEIEHWVIGGHSLGGVVAIKAILKDTSLFDGLFLFAAYPADGDDLSDWNGTALSLSAENDSLSTPTEIETSKKILPEAVLVSDLNEWPTESTQGKTIFYEIAGGNHGQFGDYGVQKKDGASSISVEEQHGQITECMLRFLKTNFDSL